MFQKNIVMGRRRKKRNIKADYLDKMFKIVEAESLGQGEFDYETPQDVFRMILNYLAEEKKKINPEN